MFYNIGTIHCFKYKCSTTATRMNDSDNLILLLRPVYGKCYNAKNLEIILIISPRLAETTIFHGTNSWFTIYPNFRSGKTYSDVFGLAKETFENIKESRDKRR